MLPCSYITIYSEALAQSDRDAFVSDWALSSIWGEDADLAATAAACGKLFDLSRMGFRQLAEFAGMSNRKLAKSLGIPARTAEDWAVGKHIPPDYVKLLIAESIGYFG